MDNVHLIEADVTIRALTSGRKTLDDFCAAFHGQNDNGTVWVKPYDADEVFRTLTTIAPYVLGSPFIGYHVQDTPAGAPVGAPIRATGDASC